MLVGGVDVREVGRLLAIKQVKKPQGGRGPQASMHAPTVVPCTMSYAVGTDMYMSLRLLRVTRLCLADGLCVAPVVGLFAQVTKQLQQAPPAPASAW